MRITLVATVRKDFLVKSFTLRHLSNHPSLYLTLLYTKFPNMKPTILHNLTWIPLMFVSIIAILLGCAWLISDTPWLLDKNANEALLQCSFDELFAEDINEHLPDYLTLAYRLFGWWVLTIGMLLGTFVQVTKMGTTLARNAIHGVLIIMIIGFYSIEYTFIPSSPFVWLTHGITLMTGISILAGTKLKEYDT